MKAIIALIVIIGSMLGVLGIVVSVPSSHQELAGVMALVFAASVTFILRGPLGRSLAGSLSDDPQLKETLAQLSLQVEDALDDARLARQETAELQERVEFAERLLAAGRDGSTHPPGGLRQ